MNKGLSSIRTPALRAEIAALARQLDAEELRMLALEEELNRRYASATSDEKAIIETALRQVAARHGRRH